MYYRCNFEIFLDIENLCSISSIYISTVQPSDMIYMYMNKLLSEGVTLGYYDSLLHNSCRVGSSIIFQGTSLGRDIVMQRDNFYPAVYHFQTHIWIQSVQHNPMNVHTWWRFVVHRDSGTTDEIYTGF